MCDDFIETYVCIARVHNAYTVWHIWENLLSFN